MKTRFTLLFLCFGFAASAQKLEVLTVEKNNARPQMDGCITRQYPLERRQ
jgi:hypothetical protein